MALPNQNDPGFSAKLALFIAAGVVALIVAGTIAGAAKSWIVFFLMFPIAAAVYVVAGASAVGTAESLNRWGMPEDYRPWSQSERMLAGAFWPLVLAGFAAVATFNRLVESFYGKN
jgi:hypothetical protein